MAVPKTFPVVMSPDPIADGGVQVDLLGAFHVRVDGHEVRADAWPTRRAAELVQLLALADGHRLPRERAIEALWPHLDPDAGAANLRKAAHHARRALDDPEAVVLRGGHVLLLPERQIETDVERFERDDDPSLYRGDLLPGAPYETWTQAPRARLRARYLELLRSAGELELLVEAEPTDEAACRELMRRELERGSRPAAIRWYGLLRSALRRELGAAPSAKTAALYDEAVADLSRVDTDLVGRELELARVTAVLRSDPSELGALVLRGPGGIGKSAICRQFARLGEDEGWAVVSVAATETAAPYAPLAASAERLTTEDPRLLDALGDQARAVLSQLASPAAADPEDPLTRHRVIGAFGRLLLEAAAGAPVAVVLDDAHLADEATIDALQHLGSAGTRSILLVLAYRPEPAPATLTAAVSRMARAGRVVEIDLEPLDHDGAAALVATAASATRTDETVERIIELGQGNPFLTLELARCAVVGVPALVPAVRDVVAARFLELDPDAAAAMRRLALAGDDLDAPAAVALSGAHETEAFVALEAGLRAGILVVEGARYRFRHELVRQALVEQLPPHHRLPIHRETAQALAEVGAEPSLIARHWLEGGWPAEAAPWLLAAARQAIDLGAYADAVASLEAVLEHDPDQPEALRLRAEALDAQGDRAAPAAYAVAAGMAGAEEAHELRAKQALAQIKLGDPPGGLKVLDGVAPTTLDGRLAQALAFAGAAALGFGDPEVGAARAAEARRLALDSGDPSAVAVASWAQAAAAHARGELRDSVRADLRDTSTLGGIAVSAFDGQLCITQRLLYGARPYDDVIEFANSLEAEAERLGASRGRAFAVTIRGEAKLLAGRLDAADADLVAGVELHRRIGGATGEAFALQRRAEVALHRGRQTEATALLDEALAVARESAVGFHLFDRIYGTLITAARDPAEALAALEEAETAVRGPIETCPGCRITLAVPAAIAAARGGDAQRASEWTHAAEYLADVVMRLPAWDAALEEVRGHLADDRSAARNHFRKAAAGFASAGQPLDESRCCALAG